MSEYLFSDEIIWVENGSHTKIFRMIDFASRQYNVQDLIVSLKILFISSSENTVSRTFQTSAKVNVDKIAKMTALESFIVYV